MWHTFPPSRLLMIMYKSVDGWPDGSLYSLLLWQLMHSLPKRLLWNISDSIWDYLTASVCVAMKQQLIHLSGRAEMLSTLCISREKKQFCFPELTVSTTTFNGTSCAQISLLCLETLCTASDEPLLGTYQQKHQQWQQNVKNWFGFGSKVNGSQRETSGAFLRQGVCGSDKEIEESRSLKLWTPLLCNMVSLWAC